MSKPKINFVNNDHLPYPCWTPYLLNKAVNINPKTKSLPNRFTYIDLESVQAGSLISKKVYERSEAPSRAQRLLEKNDVLFQMVRPYQRNNYFFQYDSALPTVASTGYAQLRTKDNCPKFIYYAIHTNKFVKNVMDRCTGGAYPAINSSDLGKIQLNIPCLEEQQKIASFFSTLDEKISIEEKKLACFKKLKKGLMQKIFSQEIRLKDESGGNFPDWQTVKLGQLLKFQNGINSSKEKFGTGTKLISVKEVLNEFPVTYASVESSIDINQEEIQRFSVEYGDIIFQRSSETAEDAGMANVYLDKKTAVFGGFVIRGKKIADYDPVFLKNMLRSNLARKQIVRLAQGAQHINIGQQQLSSIQVSLPCKHEQIKISAFMNMIEEIKKLQTSKLHALESIKRALLQKMFI